MIQPVITYGAKSDANMRRTKQMFWTAEMNMLKWDKPGG